MTDCLPCNTRTPRPTSGACWSCQHLLTRAVLGERRRNYYCTRDDDVEGEWRMVYKPSRCLPWPGARNCPGFERRMSRCEVSVRVGMADCEEVSDG